ncbi:MAG TPA: hypothetical protein VE868_07325 [Balneolaceae bacterium]|nr:hypothetical protein [Balneolaceae bacterium]
MSYSEVLKKRKIFAFSLILLIAVILTKCEGTAKQGLRKINPKSIKHLQHAASLSLYHLTCSDSSLIAADHKTNKISIIGYNGSKITHVFGRTGRGPGEFNGANYAVPEGGKLYVTDGRNKRIDVFNTSNWSPDTTISAAFSGTRFVVTGKNIYLSVPDLSNPGPIMRINKKNHTVSYFGRWLTEKQPMRNMFHLLRYQDKIIAVGFTKPVVRFYNKKGTLLAAHNLGADKDLASIMAIKRRSSHQLGSRNIVIVFPDVSIYKHYLMLTFTRKLHGKENHFLVYRIKGTSLKKVDAFNVNLHGGFVHSFCTHKNTLYSNGGSDGIDIYAFDLSFLQK